jgi:hypothetical protein
MSKNAVVPQPQPEAMRSGFGQRPTSPVPRPASKEAGEAAPPSPQPVRTVGTEIRKMFALISIR